jgi:ATP-dependent Clp protease ATP-binding subunit ClpC
MFEKFTKRSRRSIIFAREAVEEARGEHLNTEHLLLGVLRFKDSGVSEILEKLGVEKRELIDETARAIPKSDGVYVFWEIPFSQNARQAVEAAVMVSEELDHDIVSLEHMLLGLVSVKDSTAAKVLGKFGVTKEKIISAMTE